MAKMVLKTDNLAIGYGKTVVQNNLNLEAHQGSLICLTGTNGVGKSTLLRTLAGLQKPLTGKVFLQKNDVHQLKNSERANLLALVLTDSILVENLTIRQLVALGRLPYSNWAGKLSKIDEQIVNQSLKNVNLLQKADKFISEVSDGEKQRAVIAKALAQDTPLVLLDEPTSHLDLPNRIEIMLLLRRLSHETLKTFLLSTHELDLALQIADTIWLMNENGVQVGIPEDLMLSGTFQKAFDSRSFHFDESEGFCKVNFPISKCSVAVVGDGMEKKWLEKALLRCGYRISPDAEMVIHVQNGTFRIADFMAASIEEVLAFFPKI